MRWTSALAATQHERSLTRIIRTIEGVNSTKIKWNFARHGSLRKYLLQPWG